MKIRYKILTFSSENPTNPIINLVSNTGDWESARFCTYPQQITLAFNDPIIINKIKIVAHQTKVPQKINLLYHLPTVENLNEYTKIGYITFKAPKEDQQASSPQKNPILKQLKVIKGLQLKAMNLRLIINQNHLSKSNFFNQVGLSCIQIIGTTSKQMNLSQIQQKNDSMVQINSFAKDKLHILSQFKQKCIQRQQFSQANQIKQIMGQVGQLMTQIKELNEEKIRYVHEEKYIQAKAIKEEIQKVKLEIQHIVNNFYDPHKKLINKFTININRKTKTPRNDKTKSKPISKSKSKKKLDDSRNDNSSQFDNEFMKQNHQTIENDQAQDNEDNEEKDGDNQDDNYENESYIQGFYKHEQQVVPALLNKLKKSDIKSDNDQLADSKISQSLPQEPQELSPSNQANSSILTEFYEKITIRKLHSKYWQFKIQALEQILQDAKKHSNTLITKNKLKSYIFVYNRIMSRQNNKQFILTVIEIINIVTGMKVQDKDFKIEMSRELDKTIIETLQKTQDNQNPKIKMQAQKVLLRMEQSSIFGILSIYHAISKAYDEKMSSKLKKNYLDTLDHLINHSRGPVKNTIPLTIVDFAVKKLRDPNNQVRRSSINLLKSLKKHGYEERIKICMSQQKGFKQTYFKELKLV